MAADPPAGATSCHKGPRKLLETGAPGALGTGTASSAAYADEILANTQTSAQRHPDLFVYIDSNSSQMLANTMSGG
jgi:hypothetical protein